MAVNINGTQPFAPNGDGDAPPSLLSLHHTDISNQTVAETLHELSTHPDYQSIGEAGILARILHASHHIADAGDAIDTVLGMAGLHAGVHTALVYENTESGFLVRTHVWNAAGIRHHPIERVPKEEVEERFRASRLQSLGMVVIDDVSVFPENKRQDLEQAGLKAVAITRLAAHGRTYGYVCFGECLQGPRHWTNLELRHLQNVGYVISSLLARREDKREAEHSHDLFKAVADNLNDLVYISDPDTHQLLFTSNSLLKTLKQTGDDLIGQPCWKVLHRRTDGPCPFCPLPGLMAAKDKKTRVYVWEFQSRFTGKWYMVKNNIINWLEGRRAHLGTLVDISHRKQYEEKLRHFAVTDSMTEVYSRNWGYGRLTELYDRHRKGSDTQSLVFIDIDNLKMVNDRHGHAAGDELIVSVIRIITSCIRREDFICRWGGDEFIVYLKCDAKNAETVLAKINVFLEHFNAESGKPYELSFSCGLVDFDEPFPGLDALIEESDRRMYQNKQAKKQGRIVL